MISRRQANWMMALCFPLILIAGASINYGAAARLEFDLNAIARAASLAAVAPATIAQSEAVAKTIAENAFKAGAAGLTHLNFDSKSELIVTVVDSREVRNVTVAYTARSQNIFGGVPYSIPLSGRAAVSAARSMPGAF